MSTFPKSMLDIKQFERPRVCLVFCMLMQLMLLTVTVLFLVSSETNTYDAFLFSCRVGLIFVLLSILSVIVGNGGIIKPSSIIMYAFCAFQYGLPIVLVFDPSYFDHVIVNIPNQILVTCSWFSLLCIEMYSFGAIVGCYVNERKEQTVERPRRFLDLAFGNKRLVEATSLFLFIVLGAIAFFYMLWFASLSLNYDIIVAREIVSTNALRNISRGLFVPTGFLFLFFSRSNKKKNCVFAVLFIYGVIGAISGDRTESLTLLVALVYYFGAMRGGKRNSRKQRVVMFVMLILLMFSLPFIAQYRVGGSLSVDGVGDILKGVFAETGYNFYSICFQSIYNHDVHLGSSYLVSLLAMIPVSLMPDNLATFMQSNLPAVWIDEVMSLNYTWATYGQGYSMIAESAYNFGVFGIIVMGVSGYFIQRLIQAPSNKNNEFANYLSLVLLWSFITIPRRGFEFTVNVLEYDILFVFLIMLIMASIAKHKERE